MPSRACAKSWAPPTRPMPPRARSASGLPPTSSATAFTGRTLRRRRRWSWRFSFALQNCCDRKSLPYGRGAACGDVPPTPARARTGGGGRGEVVFFLPSADLLSRKTPPLGGGRGLVISPQNGRRDRKGAVG